MTFSCSREILWVKIFVKMEDENEDTIKKKTYRNQCFEKYYNYLITLFSKAAKNGGLGFICTILRVSGLELGYWDPYIESDQVLNNLSKLLRKSKGKMSYILGLLIYCHAVEMSAPYDILLNLLRSINNKPYKFLPYLRRDRKNPFRWYIPYPISKIKDLKAEATLANEEEICNIIEGFYSNKIRNAFYHSSYCLTPTHFRMVEKGNPKEIPLTEVAKKLSECFAFYSAFAIVLKKFRHSFMKAKRIFKLPKYEVLELIIDNKEGLVGFKVHFSNDTFAHFERRKNKVFGQNYSIEDEGINLFQGCTDKLKNEWRMNGRRLENKDFK